MQVVKKTTRDNDTDAVTRAYVAKSDVLVDAHAGVSLWSLLRHSEHTGNLGELLQDGGKKAVTQLNTTALPESVFEFYYTFITEVKDGGQNIRNTSERHTDQTS